MHWADVIAKSIAEKADKPIIATGISPTGIIHVGSLREAITGESIRSAVEALGKDVKLIYLIDAFDPLRKRYEFLPPEFEKYVGMPICRIPCPCGKHDNYAHHFIQPFLDAVDSLGVHCEIIWTSDLYAQGKFAECIDLTFKKRQEIINILHEVSGKEPKPDYAPYEPVCEACGRFTKPIFDTYKYPFVQYECQCGHVGQADIRKDDGKLTWRLEWPAKWKIFGTSAEPFGKDHAAAGGSYDTGKRIAPEIFGCEAPYPVPYEFVQLKGVGQMHKSLGSSVTGLDAINMTPPEVLNYLFLRVPTNRTIDYDSGIGLLDICDEYDKRETEFFSGEYDESGENSVRAYEIAQHNHVPAKLPLQVSCRHLVNVVQLADTFEEQMKVLARTVDLSQADEETMKRIKTRCECITFWLKAFAPDMVKFSVRQTIPQHVKIETLDKVFLVELLKQMQDCVWDADTINKIISDSGKASPLGSKGAYKLIYNLIIGQDRGPRLGPFLASLDKQFVMNRFAQAATQ
ncbi:MAG: lysine--tRNA ligase [archaeon]|nr:lysine--tRNA ligase [archaeon]